MKSFQSIANSLVSKKVISDITKQYPELEGKKLEVEIFYKECSRCREKDKKNLLEGRGEYDNLPVIMIRIEGKDYKPIPDQPDICLSCQEEIETAHWQVRNLNNRLVAFMDRYTYIPEELENASFDNFEMNHSSNIDLVEMAHTFINDYKNGDKYSLVLHGGFGVGKSHIARAMVKELREEKTKDGIHKYLVCFLSTEKLLNMIRESYDKDASFRESRVFQDLTHFDVIVLDELGVESLGVTPGSWTWKKMIEIIDTLKGRAVIFTSNYSPKELGELKMLDGRIVDRMKANYKTFEANGKSYRDRLRRD